MIERMTALVGSLKPISVAAIGIFFVLVFGAIDVASGYEISFSIFYLVPISFVAWFARKDLAFIVAIVSAMMWLLAEIATGHTFTHPVIPVWNASVRLGFFSIVVVMLSRLKLDYETQRDLVKELREAMDRVKILSGLLPICAWCKKIRDDKGYWTQVEGYLEEHSDASFTHSICPECEEKLRNEGLPH